MNIPVEMPDNWERYETYISNFYNWVYTRRVATAYDCYDGDIRVDLVADNTPGGDSLSQFDFGFIGSVLGDADRFFRMAVERVKAELMRMPESFGVTAAGALALQDAGQCDFPVAGPRLTFYPGREWYLLFSETGFPATQDEIGVGMLFNGNDIVTFEILNDESAEWPDTDMPVC